MLHCAPRLSDLPAGIAISVKLVGAQLVQWFLSERGAPVDFLLFNFGMAFRRLEMNL